MQAQQLELIHYTQYTVHSTFSTLHYKSGGKNNKKTQIKTENNNNNNNKHNNKKPQSISAPQDPTP